MATRDAPIALQYVAKSTVASSPAPSQKVNTTDLWWVGPAVLVFSSFIRLIFSLTSTALLIIKLCLCCKIHGFVAWEQTTQARAKPKSDLPPVFSFRQLWSEFPVRIGVWKMAAAHFPRLRNITHVMSALHACLALSSHCQWLLILLDHAMDCLEIEMRRVTWMNYFTVCVQTVFQTVRSPR